MQMVPQMQMQMGYTMQPKVVGYGTVYGQGQQQGFGHGMSYGQEAFGQGMSYGQAPQGGGYIEHIHRHHGHGHGHGHHGGASHGQQPLANVAANQVGNALGPGMASDMVTQGTGAGVGVTQGVTNAGMGALGM